MGGTYTFGGEAGLQFGMLIVESNQHLRVNSMQVPDRHLQHVLLPHGTSPCSQSEDIGRPTPAQIFPFGVAMWCKGTKQWPPDAPRKAVSSAH
ncbi:hypothetical protein PsorP6_016086 [Peronosclerospora sorghi]|uniref:Uncharacterized protein n=1 Tax=Peronosclerospora sorghi TaxID=230839 RepID=A0ACC0WNI0_9STRA|nr:hypothetical protein PsorP6_016086 [Peronosclerospora sorghi]